MIPQKSKQGFAMVLFLSALPLLVGLFFVVSFSISWIQFDLQQNHICRENSLNTQSEVGRMLKNLIALNPQALKLRQAEAKTRLEVFMAPEPVSRALAIKKLDLILVRRRILAQQQNQYIRMSNLNLFRGHQITGQKLLMNGKKFWSAFRPWLNPTYQNHFTLAPKLAVRPDFPDVAPVFQPQEQFEHKQALVHKWQYGVEVHPRLKNFLRGKFLFERTCSVSLSAEGTAWIVKIQKVKSISKSLW